MATGLYYIDQLQAHPGVVWFLPRDPSEQVRVVWSSHYFWHLWAHFANRMGERAF
ncbi:MAG TPA: hypothetical protein VKQ34_01540 [Candidatus Saccharimonadales bacterium]|nr:hypothetical protein [Candidatus Saccharimonadales bacterium]